MRSTTLSITALIAAMAATLVAQPPSAPQTAVAPSLVDGEVQIDHLCRVLTPARPNARDPKPHFRFNSIVCHLESEHVSDHWEQAPPATPNGRPKRIIVSVSEREYVLQNVTNSLVTFVVFQPLHKGWRIDSDPRPAEVTVSGAIFRVEAQPGQIVRLHVGERS
jgi:hypothetical protein